jgi:cytochrome bd-type quinol oxidase subunit 2
VLLALPAFVAIWSGWVGLGSLTGFGPVHPLPGIADGFTLNTAITLPIGVETYAAYALRIWLAGIGSTRARGFAKWSAIGSLVLGAAGQVAYHLMTARHLSAAPWPITTAVACLPVIVLGFGAALAHLQHTTDQPTDRTETA